MIRFKSRAQLKIETQISNFHSRISLERGSNEHLVVTSSKVIITLKLPSRPIFLIKPVFSSRKIAATNPNPFFLLVEIKFLSEKHTRMRLRF